MKPKDVLSKYDEEISGPKKGESFALGSKGAYDASQDRRMQEIREELQRGAHTLSKCSLSLSHARTHTLYFVYSSASCSTNVV